MPSDPPSRFQVGEFEVDLRNRVLRRNGRRVSIQDLPFEVLAHLLLTPGELVSRETLRAALWPDVSFVDWDQGLHTAARKLRGALEDDARSPRYIETVPRRGYRLIAPVRALEPEVELPLAQPVEAPGVEASSAGTRRRLHTAFFFALALGACLAFTLSFAHRSTAPLAARAFRTVSLHNVNDPGGAGANTLVSPDGRYVLLSAAALAGHPLWLEQRATGVLRPIAHSGLPFAGLELSHDGERVYFTLADPAKAMLYRQTLFGGPAEEVLPGVSGAFALSPDGREVAHLVARAEEVVLMIAGLETGRSREVARFPSAEKPDMPKWSPDGLWIAVTVGGRAGSRVVRVGARGGGRWAVSTTGWETIGAKAWLPDGSGLLMVARHPGEPNGVWLVGVEHGGERRIGAGSLDDVSPWALGLTADGRTLSGSIAFHRGALWASSPAGTGEERLLAQEWDWPVRPLSDGRILCRLGSQESRLWILDPNRPENRQQLTSAGRDLDATVSPDGRTVVYLSTRGGTAELWRVSSEGGAPSRLTHGMRAYCPAVSADGRTVFFLSTMANDLWRVPLAGGEPVRVAPGAIEALAASPDGRWLAFWRREAPDQRFELTLLPLAGGTPRRIELPVTARRGRSLHWTPDGRGVLYIDTRDGVSNLWQVAAEGGAPAAFTHFRRAFLDPIEDFAIAGGALFIGRGRWHFRPVVVDDVSSPDLPQLADHAARSGPNNGA